MSLKRTNENVLAKRTLSVAQLKEDFDIFKKTLTTIHPGIYRYNSPEYTEKLFGELGAKLKNPLAESEFLKLISQFTSQIYCGHTFPNPYNQNGIFRERISGGKSYLPFYFAIVNEKIIITENASPNNLTKGSEVRKINGFTAKEIIEKLLTVTKADGRNTLAHRVQSIELPRFEAERYALFDWYFPLFFPPESENFTIEATDFASKKQTTFQIPAMTKTERTAEIEKRYGKAPSYDDGWKFEIWNDGTAHLKIENSITWRLKKIKFKEFLAAAFVEMRAKNIKNLIIDLRGNGGGSMDVGFELSRYLAQKKLAPYAESRRLVRNVAAQPELLNNLDTYSNELKEILKKGVPASAFRKYDERYYEITGREEYPAVEPDKNNFRGKAYIIADASNASATFQFLDYAQKNNLAKIVGQPGGGNKQGINGGNYFFLSLPNSKVEIDIPVYFQAPLKSQKDESVIPDVTVKKQFDDIGNNFDRELTTVKNLIAQN